MVRARSAGSPARRARPPRPYAAPSSASRNSLSCAASRRLRHRRSPRRRRALVERGQPCPVGRLAESSMTSPRSPRGTLAGAHQVEHVRLALRLREEHGQVGHPLHRRQHGLAPAPGTVQNDPSRRNTPVAGSVAATGSGDGPSSCLHLGDALGDPGPPVERQRLARAAPARLSWSPGARSSREHRGEGRCDVGDGERCPDRGLASRARSKWSAAASYSSSRVASSPSGRSHRPRHGCADPVDEEQVPPGQEVS